LTQNTAWRNVEKAIANLKRARVLTPTKIDSISERTLARHIRPAGYYNVKARRLKNFIRFFAERYAGRIGRLQEQDMHVLREQLLAVNGIGPETCDSILLYALNKPVFVIDAYTKRILSRHGAHREDGTYDHVQELFMKSLPRSAKLYNEYHALIVRLAKERCRVKPRCDGCVLRGREISCKVRG